MSTVIEQNISEEEKKILLELESVKDPEIPVVSVVDLGMITKVVIGNESVSVYMTPTFTACPAIETIKKDIKICVEKIAGGKRVEVIVDFAVAWTSNRITEKGKVLLKNFGLAPPPKHDGEISLSMISDAKCPFCDSTNTSFRSPFGATLCRSFHYCYDCKQAFEQFKPL